MSARGNRALDAPMEEASHIAILIIVEGKHDRERLCPLLPDSVQIVCTYGIPNHSRLMEIRAQADGHDVYIFTDHDHSGRRIRGILGDEFPDAVHLHTKAEYGAVERTPVEYLTQLFLRHELIPANDPPLV